MTITEKEWFIEAPWGRLCIVAWGHCYNPPVLLCHGVMDSIVSFRHLVGLLPQNFYYIGVELPGNGKSDAFPPGLMMNFYDLVYCLEVVVKHFRWKSFMYIGHSLGGSVGMLYDFCLPGKMSRMILLDPIPPTVQPNSFARWYKRSYQKMFDEFDYYNTQMERRPAHTKEEALKKLLTVEGMSEELAAATLGRVTEDAGGGLVRFTFDHRYRIIPGAPFTPDHLKGLCLNSKAQVLVIAAEQSLKLGRYSETAFLLDDSISSNYRARQVAIHHNVHMEPPKTVVTSVSQFLVHGPEGLDAKAKL